MFTVIKLGGCNGSGKTSVARELIKLTGARGGHDQRGGRKHPNFYGTQYNGITFRALGSYESVCGGMDTISDKMDRLALLTAACKPGRIVFFEGLIIGKTYGAMGALSEQHVTSGKGKWLYAFMDTPFDVCVDRVLQRRAAAGNDAEFDPERTMRPTFNSCEHLAQKLRGERQARVGAQPYPHPVYMINHKEKPATAARKLLAAAMEMHHGR